MHVPSDNAPVFFIERFNMLPEELVGEVKGRLLFSLYLRHVCLLPSIGDGDNGHTGRGRWGIFDPPTMVYQEQICFDGFQVL